MNVKHRKEFHRTPAICPLQENQPHVSGLRFKSTVIVANYVRELLPQTLSPQCLLCGDSSGTEPTGIAGDRF